MDVIIEKQAGSIGVLRLTGRLDLLSAADLRQHVVQAVAEGTHRLVVDLAEVSFVDSSGLGALIAGLKAARLAGGDLRLAQPTAQTRSLLQLVGLDRALRLYATVEDALAGF